ncbi:hypothetical protein C922_04499 [Plasmodium inui San Antonio 1]|uniref:Uncharacterized protein n=1 Tax=Plasmodium inui San Antonio 1 TaxID=1237626 RepID=W7A7M2_9APIC|nr:hypothetical protein C922_04499 [Plasmodium inui San Antonio 1]EUD65099.1 hypothetical protein C922_04499 [Plasmodium inui San Antonio 1]
MSSINDSKKKNASSERQSSAKKGNDTKSGSKKSSGGTGSCEAKDKWNLPARAQVVQVAAIPAEGEAEMATRAEVQKDAKGNAKDVKGNSKALRTIAKDGKEAPKNKKLESKDTRLNAKDSKENAKDAKINAKNRGTPKSSTIHNAKQKSSGSSPGKNAPIKLSPPKKNDSREVASAESTSVTASHYSAHAHVNQKETEKIKLNRDEKKVSEKREKHTNKTGREESCKARNEEHQSNKQKGSSIKKKKLNCTVINEIQVKNNIYICKFKNKLNKVRKYFFPIYKYGEASIARNKAVLLKIHLHTCIYCQNGVLCNFVENYTL